MLAELFPTKLIFVMIKISFKIAVVHEGRLICRVHLKIQQFDVKPSLSAIRQFKVNKQ